MLIHEVGSSLPFDHNLIEADEISDEALLQRMTFVSKSENSLRVERHFLESKFEIQALLKHRLEKSTAFLFIYLKPGTDYFVAFVRIDKVFHVFGVFGVFRGP
jgi:hypothetical protein